MQLACMLTILLAMACRHETLVEPIVDTCPGGYPLVFGFVNQGDTTVKLIDLETKCWRANVDSSYIYYTQYESTDCDPDDLVPLQDSLVHRYYSCATPGSYKWMWVKVAQREPDCSIIRVTEWELNTSDWVYMYEPEDFTEYFRWPEDTLRYIKVCDSWE